MYSLQWLRQFDDFILQAKAEVSHPALFNKVAGRIIALDKLGAFDEQTLANTVWSYTTAEVPHPALFDKIRTISCHLIIWKHSMDGHLQRLESHTLLSLRKW